MSTSEQHRFWLDSPSELVSSLQLDPCKVDSTDEYYNVLTRLFLVVLVVLFVLDYHRDKLVYVAIFGLVAIAFMQRRSLMMNTSSATQQSASSTTEGTPIEEFGPHRGVFDCAVGQYSANPAINAKYELTPQLYFEPDNASKRSYANAKFEVIPQYVPTPYSDVWRNEASDVNPYTMTPDPYTVSPSGPMVDEDTPESQANYITRSSIDVLPGVCPESGGLMSVRDSVESAWARDSLEFRNNLIGEHVDRFMRERQHGCADFRPGRQTW